MENYVIPKGTMIMPLLWKIHRDPETWKTPEDYDPKRFLDEAGDLVRHPDFLPFQTGMRKIP